MKKKSIQLGFDVKMEMGSTWRPLQIHFWNHKKDFKNITPAKPLKYMGDALTALSLIKLNHHVKSPVANPNMDYSFAFEAWQSLEPHAVLFARSSPRVQALQNELKKSVRLNINHQSHETSAKNFAQISANFENQFNDLLGMAMTPWGIELTALIPLLESFADLEKKLDSLILYNFNLQFSKPFMETLHTLYAFLFNLRGIVAVDHNAHIQDPSHEALKVDSIYDYMPKAEYITNDALLYWSFKKLALPFCNPKSPDQRVEKLFANPLKNAFQKYSANACLLIDNLPSGFMNSLNPVELEEALHLVQMDWLLGSPAGLIFKIREELFGLHSGYEKIFWKDAEPIFHDQNFNLQLCFELTEASVFGNRAA